MTKDYVDITPSWAGITPGLLEVWRDGETAEARRDAYLELMRMARLADRFVRVHKFFDTRPTGKDIAMITRLVKEQE